MTTSIRENLGVDRATSCFHQLFEEQARRTPKAAAVICEDRSLTYYELNARANQLAHYLRRLGVGQEVIVGLCLERTVDIVIGLLAIFKAGGVYFPIDPEYPSERIAFFLEDTRAAVLITQEHLKEKLPENLPSLICLDADSAAIAQQSEFNSESGVRGEHLAYVLYTSGSTGKPKGVLIEHHALASHCLAVIECNELCASDVVLEFSTFAFDASLEQMLPALLVGAKVVMRGSEIWTPGEMLRQLRMHQFTWVSMPVAYWHQVLSEWALDPQQLEGHALRLLAAGGDRFPTEVVQLWQQLPLRTARFMNVYGPTEATITATYYEIPAEAAGEQTLENIPIGRAFPHKTIYILDEAGQPAPEGVAGELYIGGDLLARGYLNRPELTTERFVPDPFSQKPRARLYRTGDLARYLPDGNIECLGRIDQQVKIRGMRIELGEIEAALSQHPAVRQAVVAAREDRPGDRRLVAYIVPFQGQTVSREELRSLGAQRLPAYMVPTLFVFLDELPLSANGKVDRRALPAPDLALERSGEPYVAPVLPLHHQLVQIWEDVLGVQPIGIQDDFFALGGHSLKAVTLFNRIEQVCGKKLPVSTLFAGATIEQLATVLTSETQARTEGLPAYIPLQVEGTRRPFFFLHGQTREDQTLHCYPLARALGPDQPFYGLYPYDIARDLRRGHLPTLEEVADAHIRTIRALQPEGPYLLGGFCNGALVAYVIAQRLRSEGQEVDLLALIDPSMLVYGLPYKLYYAFFQLLSKLLHWSQARSVAWSLRVKHALRLLVLKLLRQTDTDPRTFAELLEDYFRLYDWVVLGYRPARVYEGKITFFWAREGQTVQNLRRGWQAVEARGNVEVQPIPGEHTTCKTSYLSDLGSILADAVHRAHAARESQAFSPTSV